MVFGRTIRGLHWLTATKQPLIVCYQEDQTLKNRKTICPCPALHLLASCLALALIGFKATGQEAPNLQPPATDNSALSPDPSLLTDPDGAAAPAGSVDADGANGSISPGGPSTGDILNFQADLFT